MHQSMNVPQHTSSSGNYTIVAILAVVAILTIVAILAVGAILTIVAIWTIVAIVAVLAIVSVRPATFLIGDSILSIVSV
jgi:hypothetical protein